VLELRVCSLSTVLKPRVSSLSTVLKPRVNCLSTVLQFMDAEKDKRIVEREHELKATAYNSIQQRLALIVKDMSRTIIKSK